MTPALPNNSMKYSIPLDDLAVDLKSILPLSFKDNKFDYLKISTSHNLSQVDTRQDSYRNSGFIDIFSSGNIDVKIIQQF